MKSHKTSDTVSIGSTIEIRDLSSNESEMYTLVSPAEADIALNRISSLTPMGKAIYGKKVGDVVDVDAPGGVFRFRIEEIDHSEDVDSVGEFARAG